MSVNRRVVKDRTLVHAIRLAYDGKIPEGRYACYAVDIHIPPDEVDVNVHPTKTEVRFVEPRRIHDQLYSFVSYSLSAHANLAVPSEAAEPAAPYKRTDDRMQSVKEEPRYQSRSYAQVAKSKRSNTAGRLFAENRTADNLFVGIYSKRYALVKPQHKQGLIQQNGDANWPVFLDLSRLLTALFVARLTQDKRSRPLIIPEIIPGDSHDLFADEDERFGDYGVVISRQEPGRLVLKALPLVLLPVNHEDFLLLLAKQADKQNSTSIKDIAIAASESILIPMELSAQERWFAQILDQLGSAEIGWQDYLVLRTEEQWQGFLGE